MRYFPDRPAPHFGRLDMVLRRSGEPDAVPFFEVLIDLAVMEAILGRTVSTVKDIADCYCTLGYDYAMANGVVGIDFPMDGVKTSAYSEEMSLSRRHRSYRTASMNTIAGWEDFDSYPWPDPNRLDYRPLCDLGRALRQDMKVIVGGGHVFEVALSLLGHEQFSYAMVDDPALLDAIFERVGSAYESFYRNCLDTGFVGAVLVADDLGFKTQTVIAPAMLRKWVFPWYRRYSDLCHARDVPIILHSCGNVYDVIDDLIDCCGFDAKHSYEDQILPVTEAKGRYGDRIAVLGGLDMHFMVTAQPEEVSRRTMDVLRSCAPGGGYALGTGNSIAEYIPVRNYLAMLRAGDEFSAKGAV